jgi:hypothetical protein
VSNTLADWLSAIFVAPDLGDAACIGLSDLFDATDDPVAVEQAVDICRGCAARQRCRDWLATQPPNAVSGVVAGEVLRWSDGRRRKTA